MQNVNSISEIETIFKDLGIDFETKSSYNLRCPHCADGRKKQNTKSLHVKINPPFIDIKCHHDGCKFSSPLSYKVNENITVEEISYNPFPIEAGDYPFENEASIWYPYCNDKNQILFYIERNINRPMPKVLPWSKGEDGSWFMKRPSGKFLYKSEKLSSDISRPVIIVEGEKTADYTAALFKRADVVTWPGGANNVTQGNWDLLKNRKCILWPDNDKPGIEAMKQVAELIDSDDVRIVNTDGLPEKWDLADNGVELITIADRYKNAVHVKKPMIRGMLKWSDIQKKMEANLEFIDSGLGFKLPLTGLAVFLGRTGHGKTAVMCNIASHLLDTGYNVGFISYELSIEKMGWRLQELNPNTPTYNDSEQLILTDQNASIVEIVELMRRLSTKSRRSVLFLDYIQIMPHIDKDYSQLYSKVKNVVQTLRHHANLYNQLVILGSQSTPSINGGKDNPFFDSTRESKDIEMSANAMFRVWNKTQALELTKTTFLEEVPGELIIEIRKSQGNAKVGQKFGYNWIVEGSKIKPADNKLILDTEAF